jgi:hypothetical protein
MNRLLLRVAFVSLCWAGLFIQHVAAAPAGLCTYHCFCKARCGSGTVGTSINDPIIDWGEIRTYTNDCLPFPRAGARMRPLIPPASRGNPGWRPRG